MNFKLLLLQAGAIIGKGGHGITQIRQQYGDKSIRVIDNAKANMPSYFNTGSGVKDADDAIQIDCSLSEAVHLLQDVAPRLIRFQVHLTALASQSSDAVSKPRS